MFLSFFYSLLYIIDCTELNTPTFTSPCSFLKVLSSLICCFSCFVLSQFKKKKWIQYTISRTQSKDIKVKYDQTESCIRSFQSYSICRQFATAISRLINNKTLDHSKRVIVLSVSQVTIILPVSNKNPSGLFIIWLMKKLKILQ